jgi:hypothetical protein
MTTLAAVLLRNQAAPIDAVENAMLRQSLYGGDLATNLLELAAVDERTLLEQLALAFEIETVPPGPLPLASEELKKALPAEVGARHCMFPLGLEGEDMLVAVSVPLMPSTLEDLAFSLGYELRQHIALEVRVRQALSRDYRLPFAERYVRLSLSLDRGQPLNLSIPPPKVVTRNAMDSQRGEPMPNDSATTNVPTLVSSRPALLTRPIAQPVRPIVTKPQRRLGPFTTAMAGRELKEAKSAKEILKIWLDFSAQFFEYAAIFTIQGEMASGQESRGMGPNSEYISRIGIPLEYPSVLADARRLGRWNLATLGSDGVNATFARDLQRELGQKVFAVPVMLRGRAVALLYGDQGDADVQLEQLGEVVAITAVIERALGRVLLSRKKGQSGEPPEPPSNAPISLVTGDDDQSSVGTNATSQHRTRSPSPDSAKASHQTNAAPQSVTARPHMMAASESPSGSNLDSMPRTRKSDLARPIVEIGTSHERTVPPPLNPEMAQPTSVPTLMPPMAPVSEIRAGTTTDEAASVAAGQNMPGHNAPMRRIDTDYESKSLSVIDRIRSGDESAIDDLLAYGDAGASVLVRELPGPVQVPTRAARPDLGPVRASECGPLLRAMAAFGPTARPYVIARTADAEPQVRQWATRLLGELPGRQSAMAVAQRMMHDRDPEVRRAAFAAGQLLTHDAESAQALRGALSGAARNETLAVTQRLAALDALSDLREGQAIPAVSRLLQDANPSIKAAARQALSILACCDFLYDIDRWSHWWAHNGQRHRVEWLIDALTDDSSSIRQSAAEELRMITRLYVGHYDDNVLEQRSRVQERYRQWWEESGRAALSAEQH